LFTAQTVLHEAALRCEQTPPSSFEEKSGFAQAARALYPDILDTALAHSDWAFASKVQPLAQEANPDFHPDLPLAFELPEDLVQFRELLGAPDVVFQVFANNQFRSDQAGPHHVRYTARITDESRMTPTFRRALALALAARLAPLFNPVQNRIAALEQERDGTFAEARRLDALSASPRNWRGEDHAVDWVQAAMQ